MQIPNGIRSPDSCQYPSFFVQVVISQQPVLSSGIHACKFRVKLPSHLNNLFHQTFPSLSNQNLFIKDSMPLVKGI